MQEPQNPQPRNSFPMIVILIFIIGAVIFFLLNRIDLTAIFAISAICLAMWLIWRAVAPEDFDD